MDRARKELSRNIEEEQPNSSLSPGSQANKTCNFILDHYPHFLKTATEAKIGNCPSSAISDNF